MSVPGIGGGLAASREKQLIKELIDFYEDQGRYGRPVLEHSDSMLVNFSLSLIQIVDIDEKNQVLKINVWYHYKWMDRLLRWNPVLHDNITSIRIPSDKIWLPDILLYNLLQDDVYKHIMELGILHNSPPSTKRGCRAGRLHRLWHGLPPAPWPCTRSQHHSVPSRNLHPLMVPPFLQPHPDLQSAVGNTPLSSKHPAQLPTTDCLLSIISPMGGQPSDAPALSPPSPLQQGGQSSNAPALSPPSPLPQGGQPIALALSPPSPPPQGGQPSDAPGLSPSSSTLLLCPSDSTLNICHLNSQSAVKTDVSPHSFLHSNHVRKKVIPLSADDRLKERREALAVVENTGQILWMPQAMLNSSCAFDTLFFPFDQQQCELKFGSWTYDGFKLDVDFIEGQQSMDLSDFTPNNEWTIMFNGGVKNVQYYSCCPEPYPDITFTLTIRRKVAFYAFILLLPCALLSLLTMLIFWVPPESPAKLQIGMNIFLAFFVLLLLLADFTPRAAASIPLIGAYFCLSMIMITLSTVMACIVANMFFRGVRHNRAPRWLRSCVIDGLARALCMRSSFLEPRTDVTTPKKTWSTYVSTYRSFSDPETLCAKVHLLDKGGIEDSKLEDMDDFCGLEELFAEFSQEWEEEETAQLVSEVTSIKEMLTLMEDRRDENEVKLRHIREWRIIAVVLDRLFFLIYFTINLLGLVAIFVRIFFPH
ncbi:hypothetical protein ACOMHN_062330 [Nucella lapillus]